MGRIIAVANQKGGVGKTTTAVNLGAGLALAGRRVLLVDVDPQSNLTSGVGAKGRTAPVGSIYHALVGEPTGLAPFVVPTVVENLNIVPSDRNLTGAEIELVSLPQRESRLRRLLRPLSHAYDYVLVDCPPSLGLLTLNALVAADAVLITLHCEYYALEGLADLVGTLKRVRAALNRDLDIEGVLLTMYDERTNLGQQVARDIREFFKEKVFDTVIPRNVRLGEAPSHGLPVLLYDAKSRGAEAYFALAREVVARTPRTTPAASSLPAVQDFAQAQTPAAATNADSAQQSEAAAHIEDGAADPGIEPRDAAGAADHSAAAGGSDDSVKDDSMNEAATPPAREPEEEIS